MISKKALLNGGIVLLICIALTLPAAAIELNPMNYILKQPATVQAVNKTMVNHAIVTPVERVTIRSRVTSAASPVNVPTMSQVSSGSVCTPDSGPVILEGTITEIQYTDVYDTTFTIMKLTGSGEVALFPVDNGNRERVYHLLETAYIKGNTIHIVTNGACSLESFALLDRTDKQYPTYKIVMIDLGPDHP